MILVRGIERHTLQGHREASIAESGVFAHLNPTKGVVEEFAEEGYALRFVVLTDTRSSFIESI